MRNRVAVGSIRIPAFSQLEWIKLLFGLTGLGLIVYAFWYQPVERGLTAYQWLVGHWGNVSNYSHGPLIPLIASALVWWNVTAGHVGAPGRWRHYTIAVGAYIAVGLAPGILGKFHPPLEMPLYAVTVRITPLLLAWQMCALGRPLLERAGHSVAWAAAGVVVAMTVYYFGVKAIQPRLVVFSFVLLLYALTLVAGGRSLFRVLFFPITFLLLMIPLNFLDEAIGFPLRMAMTSASSWLLNSVGVEAIRHGTAIYSPTGLFKLDVAAPCSGIRSLMALMTVTAAFGYVTKRVQWKRWVLFLSAMPLAVVGNMARVTSIALVSQVYSQKFGTTDYHDAAGFIVYAVALTAMVALGYLLDAPYRRWFESWLRPPDDAGKTAANPRPSMQEGETL